MGQYEKHFTLEEAREMLPWVRQRIRRLQECVRLLEKQGHKFFGTEGLEFDTAELSFSKNGEGTHTFPREYLEILHLIGEFAKEGIVIKSAAEGLIDFPAITPWGEEVYLCYLEGEADIEFWHSLEGGFRGRRTVEGIFTEKGQQR